MKNLLVIFLGGGIGSVGRYVIGTTIQRYFATPFPAGTFIVNITGCLLIGLIYGLSLRYSWLTVEWRLFLVTGICGGYTTFSSFSYEAVNLVREGNIWNFIAYISLSVAVGLLATFGGAALVR